MAFNPFQAFRKHKKVTFAALTIVCMFVFVLQAGFSGGADPLDRLARFLGTRGFRESDVASLNGKPITMPELQDVRRQRELASTYMSMVAEQVAQSFQAQAFASMGKDNKLSPDDAGSHGLYATYARSLQGYLHPFRDPRMRRLAYFEPEVDMQPYTAQKLVDFLVWKEQARKLGINLTDEALNEEINRSLHRGLTKRISGPIEAALAQDQRFKGISLLDALRDEYNVRLAKAAILGDVYPPMPVARVPISVTPNEFWDFFKDQRTELDVALLPVRVEDYLAQVTAQPTEADLRKLYDRYKGQEYDPDGRFDGSSDDPYKAFRQPRRIQVQWIGGDPDSSYYVQKGKELAVLHESLARITAGVPNAPLLGGVLPPSISIATPLIVDLPLAAKYYQERFKLNEMGDIALRAPYWSQDIRSPLRHESLFQPAAVAAVVGKGLASPAWSVWPNWLGLGMAAERQHRAELAAQLVLSKSPVAAAAAVFQLAPRETVLPIDAVQDWVAARYLDQLSRDVLIHNLNTVRKQVEESRKDKKLDNLDKLVAEQAEKYSLITGKSTAPRGLHRDPIGDDPGLKPLRQAYTRRPGDPLGRFFGHVFFSQGKVYDVETWPRGFGDASDPDRDPWRTADELFLIWKTDDQPARTLPLSDPAVRQEVEKAWRWQKARELAKKSAEELAKEAAALKGDLPKLRDFALRHKEELVEELPKLAKRIKIEEQRPDFPLRYRQPNLPESKVPNLGFAGEPSFGIPPDLSYRRFMDKVLDLKDKPLGTAVAVTNKPESIYYVAILTRQHEPSREEFLRAYKEATAVGERRGDLFRLFMQQQATKFYEQFIQALRQDAKLEVNEERLEAFDGNRGDEI